MADDLYYTESFLTRAIADFREQTDEPSVNAKYSDARIIKKLEEAYSLILGDLNRISVNQVVARYTVPIVDGVEAYILPPTVGMVLAIYTGTSGGYRVFYRSYGRLNPCGRGVWLEGRTIHVQPGVLGAGAELKVEYTPNAPRLCNGVCEVDADAVTVTIAAEDIHQGVLDTRQNAYAGCTLRILGDTDDDFNFGQEATIQSHDPATGVLTLETPLSPNYAETTGETVFEIAPAIPILMDQVIPMFAAYRVALVEGSVTRSNMLRRAYWDALRSVQLAAFYSDLQNAPNASADNFNNRRFRGR